ncbi:alpha/beta hydrolase [Novosphingopyxis sp. YJ-S2-01]|uniref:alpha/beta hydrolase n=1 Tax=Novosphingopyxis sp. YJ-S2-01 TaxID=2794021 RepID=UPI0018DE3C9E|nr:alpha/beta hydrolase [Novosphingopyxis sp. YJ-S2-01]MBH9538625.1 alpha/beta hydrolase [Novosphingopyxis sp. YJ-S2-01]
MIRQTVSAAWLLLAVLIGLGGCAQAVREYIYQPSALAETPVTFAGAQPRSVSTTTADGLTLNGYYWAPSKPDGDMVVYFHGNGFNQLVAAARAEPLAADGHGVLVASYRGYGNNPGSPSERGLFADGDSWMERARALAPGSRIFVFGHSLGGAVALEMSARHRVDGVATLGTFSRLAAVAPAVSRGVLPDRFDNIAALQRIDAPVFLFHGTADETIPFTEAEKLAASSSAAALLPLPNGKHHISMKMLAPFVWQAFETGTLDPALLR